MTPPSPDSPSDRLSVALIVPGSGGGFYCENCLRDVPLASELRRLGHDVLLAPMYLPLFDADVESSRSVPLFFGGINVFLQQKLALFRRTPRWLDRCLDAPWLLRLAAGRAASTRARDLGETTLSLLQGERGRQRKEVRRLIEWLGSRPPRVVHLSNALLLGLARPLRETLGAAVVCSLQDEDTWLDAMPEEAARACWRAVREAAAEVTRFLAVSRYYAERMGARMGVEAARIRVVHPGLDPQGYEPSSLSRNPPTVGFLARLSRAHGLDALVEAVLQLRRSGRWPALRLRAAGGWTADDRALHRRLRRRVAAEGAAADVEFLEALDRPRRLAFLRSLDVLCVPLREDPALGLWAVEAMACGVPVVAPRRGALPEIVEPWEAGLLYDPRREDALPEALEAVLSHPQRAGQMGRNGRRAFLEHFTLRRMAIETAAVYREAQTDRALAAPSPAGGSTA